MLARGAARRRPVPFDAGESEGEAARQRVVRRADVLGWFLTENGRRVRFFVDTDDWRRVAPGVTQALEASGLGLAPAASGDLEAQPLWPDPRRRSRLLPIAFAAVWSFFALVAIQAGARRRRRAGRAGTG